MRLINDYVMVRKISEKEKEGLVTASASDSLVCRGEVILLADIYGSSVISGGEFSAGTTVWFAKYAGEEQEVNGEKVKFIKYEDIIAYE